MVELKIPGKGMVQVQPQSQPAEHKRAAATHIVPGQKFVIKRAAQINGVPSTVQEDLQTLAEVQKARGDAIWNDNDLANKVIRFRRAGVEIEITPDPSQIKAVLSVIHEQFACITGAAGTGKTTVERIILQRLEQMQSQVDLSRYGRVDANAVVAKAHKVTSIAFCAFTGKAMQQMKKNLPEDYQANCFTIHMLLAFGPIWYEVDEFDPVTRQTIIKTKMKFVPYYTAENKLPWKVIIIDEASMVPIELWNQLIEACHPDTRIILIGDINQLPPVMGRSVFGYALQQWPSYELTQIHRQKGEDNPIVDNAWKILQGKLPQDVPGKFDLFEIEKGSTPAMSMLLKVTLAAWKKGIFDPERDMIIVPQNVGEIGQERINERLIPYFNPKQENSLDPKGKRVTISAGFDYKFFAVGDKVMATKNDYESGVTNGMLGTITDLFGNVNYKGSHKGGAGAVHLDEGEIDSLMAFTELQHDAAEIAPQTDAGDKDLGKRAASHVITVDFGLDQLGNPIIVEFATTGQVQSLMLAYAATCHKCQGSEFKTVIILVSAVNAHMLNREWLYTAVTRAAERVLLIYDRRGLLSALARQRIKGKNLQEKAQAFIEWQEEISKSGKSEDELFSLLPTLWKPRKVA